MAQDSTNCADSAVVWMKTLSSENMRGKWCARCSKSLRNMEDLLPGLPSLLEEDAGAVDAVKCVMECGVEYCSHLCREMDFHQGGHKFVCVGQCGDEYHPLYQFKVLAFGSGFYNELNLALKLLARVLGEREDPFAVPFSIAELVEESPLWEKMADDRAAVKELVDDLFNMLRAGIPAMGASDINRDTWSKIIGYVVQNNMTIDGLLKYPLLEYCRVLARADPETQAFAEAFLVPAVENLFNREEDGTTLKGSQGLYSSSSSQDNHNLPDEYNEEEGEDLAKVAEFGGEDDDDDEGEDDGEGEEGTNNENDSPGVTIGRLLSEPERYIQLPSVSLVVLHKPPFKHSCVPSMELSFSMGHHDLVAIKQSTKFGTTDQTTVSVVDRKLEFDDRQAELYERCINCDCARCEFEAGRVEKIKETELESLLELAQTDMRLDDALSILDELLQRNPASTIALFTKARILGWVDKWAEAHELRMRSVSSLPAEDEYVIQMKKQVEAELEFCFDDLPACSKEDVITSFEQTSVQSSGDDSIIYTSRESIPAISKELCAKIIAESEAFAAQNGGWCSTRHYSVPTTDIAIHNVPALKSLLKPAFRELFPKIGAMFGVPPSSIRFIDLFVVKYIAEKQFYLPVHCDQSQFSITIALNDRCEYVGGGTWFPDLDLALNCDAGGVVAFEGNVAHGGNAISSGTRYIIAGFMYSTVSRQRLNSESSEHFSD